MNLAPKIAKITGLILLGIVYALGILWCSGAIMHANEIPVVIRWICLALFVILTGSAPFFRPHVYYLGGSAFLMFLVIALWQFKKPNPDVSWRMEYAKLPKIEQINETTYRIHDIRDFKFNEGRSKEPGYLTYDYNIKELSQVDYIQVHWENAFKNLVAHSMLAFHFKNAPVLVASFEVRRPVGNEYSPVGDLYKQDYVSWIIGTETDLIADRTNSRAREMNGEQVHIYPLNISEEQRFRIFLKLVKEVSSIREKTRFYNTLTDNCITNLCEVLKAGLDLPLWHYSYLTNGYFDRLLFQEGFLQETPYEISFEDFKKSHCVNERTRGWSYSMKNCEQDYHKRIYPEGEAEQ